MTAAILATSAVLSVLGIVCCAAVLATIARSGERGGIVFGAGYCLGCLFPPVAVLALLIDCAAPSSLANGGGGEQACWLHSAGIVALLVGAAPAQAAHALLVVWRAYALVFRRGDVSTRAALLLSALLLGAPLALVGALLGRVSLAALALAASLVALTIVVTAAAVTYAFWRNIRRAARARDQALPSSRRPRARVAPARHVETKRADDLLLITARRKTGGAWLTAALAASHELLQPPPPMQQLSSSSASSSSPSPHHALRPHRTPSSPLPAPPSVPAAAASAAASAKHTLGPPARLEPYIFAVDSLGSTGPQSGHPSGPNTAARTEGGRSGEHRRGRSNTAGKVAQRTAAVLLAYVLGWWPLVALGAGGTAIAAWSVDALLLCAAAHSLVAPLTYGWGHTRLRLQLVLCVPRFARRATTTVWRTAPVDPVAATARPASAARRDSSSHDDGEPLGRRSGPDEPSGAPLATHSDARTYAPSTLPTLPFPTVSPDVSSS